MTLKIDKNSYLKNRLEQTHLNLLLNTLKFIKNTYPKPIHKRDDPDIFISLIEEYCKKNELGDGIILQKILQKLRSRSYIENSKLNSEILNLLIIPLNEKRGYFTVLHLETLDPEMYPLMLKYFEFVEKDFSAYVLTSTQILNLNPLLEKNIEINREGIIKKIRQLQFSCDSNLRYLRRSLNSTIDSKSVFIDLNTKHLFLTVQLILIKNTLYSETYEEIYFYRDLLTDFLFLSRLVN